MIESHYGQAQTTKVLSSHLSVARIYEMYVELHEPEVHAFIKAGKEAILKQSTNFTVTTSILISTCPLDSQKRTRM